MMTFSPKLQFFRTYNFLKDSKLANAEESQSLNSRDLHLIGPFSVALDTSPLNLCRTCAFQRPAVLHVSVKGFEGLLTCPPCVSCSHLVTPGTDSITPLNLVRL